MMSEPKQESMKADPVELDLASDASFRHVIEKNADGILIIDHAGFIRFSNPAAESLLARSRAALSGQPFGFPLAADNTIEIDLLRPDGALVAEMRVVEVVWAGQSAFLASLRDITERKTAERLIRLQRDLAYMLSESSDLTATLAKTLDTLLLLDEIDAGGIYLVDDQNGSLKLIVHQGLSDAFVAEVSHYSTDSAQIRLALAKGPTYVLAHDLTGNADQAAILAEDICSLAILPVQFKGEAIALLNLASRSCLVLSELTKETLESISVAIGSFVARAKAEAEIRQKNEDLKELHRDLHNKMQILQETQTRLLQSEKLAAIGKLVAGLAHELNNPLASIVLHAQLLQQGNLENHSRRDLAEIVKQSRRMSHIVHSLLDFARPQPSVRTFLNVNEVVERAVSFVAYDLRSHQISWMLDLATDLLPVEIEEIKLQQALINLINNALYAMYKAHGRGQLIIKTEIDSHYLANGRYADTGLVRIAVQDDGPGVPPSAQSRLFDPFFTTKPVGEGTGLGLSLAHSMIAEHDGKIWFETSADKGTTFYIELPITEPPLTRVGGGHGRFPADPDLLIRETAVTSGDTAVRPRILVVDDERALLEAIAEVLSRSGYAVEGAADGYKALAAMAEGQYDLIICDLMMPGMNGMDLYRTVAEYFPDLVDKFIFITGDTVSPSAQQFLSTVGKSYLAKPFDLIALKSLVQTRLPQSAPLPLP